MRGYYELGNSSSGEDANVMVVGSGNTPERNRQMCGYSSELNAVGGNGMGGNMPNPMDQHHYNPNNLGNPNPNLSGNLGQNLGGNKRQTQTQTRQSNQNSGGRPGLTVAD